MNKLLKNKLIFLSVALFIVTGLASCKRVNSSSENLPSSEQSSNLPSSEQSSETQNESGSSNSISSSNGSSGENSFNNNSSEDSNSGDNNPPESYIKIESDEYVANKEYDIVVYGDTAAAVIASVAASRQNAKVALVAPNVHLGGMVSGGLSQTDLGDSSVIGGMSREFFKRNAIKKGGSKKVDWYFEPHIAEEIFVDMINETKESDYPIEVFTGERLVENDGVEMDGNTIDKIICESGKVFDGVHFIDASYEGDLMAQAGVSYTYGREGKNEYNESLAGVVSPTVAGAANHNFKYDIKAYDDNGKLKYQEVSEEPLAEVGTGDKKIQAYNFRMVLTNDPSNKIEFPKPEGYDAKRYALLGDYLNVWYQSTGKAPTAHELFGFRDGVNNKWDFNNKGAFSTDYIGGNYNYPNGTYAEREQIWQEHYKYTAGLLYFLANDPSVPDATRKEVASYGLPKDEYQDSNNWTFQLYVREGRRMLGEYIMTQKDIEKGGKYLTKPDSIGMGSYNSDSHNVQRYITKDGYIRNEGNMEVKVDPYEIPYRTLLPKKQEADNLLVTCTLSASHVAYSTIRMEPQYMIIGEAAGTAAAIAIADEAKVHDINIAKLQNLLSKGGSILSKTDKNNLPTYGKNIVFYDSMDDFASGWTESKHTSAPSFKVTQNDTYASLTKEYSSNYSFLTRKNFGAPTTDFTLSFKAKLNSKSDTEFTIRNKGYLVKVVLVNDGDGRGEVKSDYASEAKTYSVNTSEWHDYKVVVIKDTDNQYKYSLYVDNQLAWSEAYHSSGFTSSSTDIFKIGNEGVTKTNGTGVTDLDLDYIKIEKGIAPQGINLVGSIYRDSYYNKVTNLHSDLAFNNLYVTLFVENNMDDEQNVKIKVSVENSEGILELYTFEQMQALKAGELKELHIKIDLPEDKSDLKIKTNIYYGENYNESIDSSVEL